MKTLMTTREVAYELGFSSRHVCRLVNENKLLPYAKLSNGHNIFSPDEIENYKKLNPKKMNKTS